MVPPSTPRLLMTAVAALLLCHCLSPARGSAAPPSTSNSPIADQYGDGCSSLLANVSIPAAIRVPAGQKLQVAFYAVGLQHYTFNGSAWVLFNATADLYQQKLIAAPHAAGGRKHLRAQKKKPQAVGQHFFLPHPDAAGGQPSWETFLPSTSLVTARSLQAVTVDPNSITWDLFQATNESGSKDLLGAVTYLQRLESKGGLPPSSIDGARTGDVEATPYSIIYAFYVKED